MEDLLEKKRIFDEFFEIVHEGGAYTFTYENISEQYSSYLFLLKYTSIYPKYVNSYLVQYVYYDNNKIIFRCERERDEEVYSLIEFFVTPDEIYEGEFPKNYLDDLTIEFYN